MSQDPQSLDGADPTGLQRPVRFEELDCPDFVPPQERDVLPRCRISVTEEGRLAQFCRNCQVQRIRAQAHCRHLGFQSRVRVGLLARPGVQAVLTCGLTGRRTRLARCRRCPSYQE